MSRRIHAAHGPEALRALEFMAGWSGGWMPVYRYRDGVRGARMLWHETGRPGSGDALARFVARADERYSDEILIGLPQARRWNGGIGAATVLWARIEGKDQEARARRFRPLPSLVLQEGASSRRWLVWALRERAGYFEVEAANRKIAYALRAVQKYGDPDAFLVPAPGSCLRVDRGRPVPIVCGRLSDADYTVAGVVGRLKEPPAKDAWMTAAR
jgi:hypothetical protein